MFLSKNLMEAGGAVKVELLRIQGLACSNNAWVGELVLEKSNAFKFFVANQVLVLLRVRNSTGTSSDVQVAMYKSRCTSRDVQVAMYK